MKLARIQYPSGMKEKDKAEWRNRLKQLAANIKGNAKLEAIVRKCEAEIKPIKGRISVEIDSKYVTPCIKYASAEYAIITDLTVDVKVYYSPFNPSDYCH